MQMSPFEFVTIFCSLILGLALSHILRAVTDLYEIRDRVKTYWLNSLWVVTVTMWSVFAWWGLWQLSIDLNEWHYAQYWFLVTNLASIYFFTTLVLPKATDAGEIDLEKHYYSVHQAFFSIVAFSLFTSSAVNYSLFDQPMMAIPPFIVGCAAVAAAFTESRPYHKFIGIFVFIMFIFFQVSDVTVIEYSV
ncbi:MAG: hypothetical protein CMA11_03490 [Euryarchaeota archaeon]|nr:hypothetical protein [Euryarchaeota archaeon]|tara:strand:+ start:228 stop:800 length:573 start_codon:yes stop_codon:yes gene_type:complete